VSAPARSATTAIDGSSGGLYSKTIARSYQDGNGVPGRYAGVAISADSYSVTYSYDAYGRSGSMTGGADTFTYAYLANSDLLAAIAYPHGIASTRTYDDIQLRPPATPVDYVGQDGNVTAYVDSSDDVVYSADYSPFGEAFSESGTAPCAFGFSTIYRDEETGFLIYRFRPYDPARGVWPAKDPIGDIGHFAVHALPFEVDIVSEAYNPYRHTRNNPISYIDTDGRLVVTLIVGGVVLVGGYILKEFIEPDPTKAGSITAAPTGKLTWERTVKECTIFIAYGHHWRNYAHPGLQNIEMTATDPKTSCCAYVGCFANELNNPSPLPGYTPVDTYLPHGGALNIAFEKLDTTLGKELKKARDAARRQAKEICKDKNSCCKQVEIKYEGFARSLGEVFRWPSPSNETIDCKR